MPHSVRVLWMICLLSLGAKAIAGNLEQQQGSWDSKQTGTCTAAGSQMHIHVSAAVIPAHGSTPEEAAQYTRVIAATIAPLSTSMIVITPDGTTYNHAQTKPAITTAEEEQSVPALLHHHIKWTGDASAAITEAAEVTQRNGATWLLLIRTGDEIHLQDSKLVLQQLQGACSNAQMLACHPDEHNPEAQACLFRLPLDGRFEGPTKQVFVPHPASTAGRASTLDSKHGTSSKSSTKPGSADMQLPTGSQNSKDSTCRSKAAGSQLPHAATQEQSDCISIQGMFYQPAEPTAHHLASQVHALRKHLRAEPSNKAWWLFQLAEAYSLLGNNEQAVQQYSSAYEASSSRRLAAAAMYRVAELRLTAGDFQGSIAAASKGLARHTMPDLLWIASLAAYRSAQYKSAVNWAEMAAQLTCAGKSGCEVDRPAAFADVSTWYEKPYDVLRYAYEQLQGREDAAQKAHSNWEAAELLRKQDVNGSNNSRFVLLGVQALALFNHPEEDVYVQPQLPSKPRIALSMTTAHRPHLFTRTWYSFRCRCLDCSKMIDKWYAVDDGSSSEDLAVMQQAAPPCMLTWLDKAADAAGHVGSLNRILEEVLSQGFDYLLHLEDDWYFTVEENLVSKALRVMQHDPSISQVLFNQDFADTDADWERKMVASGEARITADGLQYIVHVFAGPKGSKELSEYVEKHAKDKLSNFHWPGFSLRPGLWRLSAFRQIGKFVATPRFEEVYASKLHAAGFRTAFLQGSACIHLAPTASWLQERVEDINAMYARHGLSLLHSAHHQHSAYDSNVASR